MNLQDTPYERRKEENSKRRLAANILYEITDNRHIFGLYARELLPIYWNTLDGEKQLVDLKVLMLDTLPNGDWFVCAIRDDIEVCTYGYIGLYSDQFYEQSITTIAQEYDFDVLDKAQDILSSILHDYHEFKNSKS